MDPGRKNQSEGQDSLVLPRIQTSSNSLEPFATRSTGPDKMLSTDLPVTETAIKHGIQEDGKDRSACLLSIPKDSPLFQRHWITINDLNSPEHGNEDPLVYMEKMQKAIGQVVSVKANLDHCIKEKLREGEEKLRRLSISECELKEDLKLCREEREEYKQMHATATETVAETRQYFQKQLDALKEKNRQATKTHEQRETDLRYTVQTQDKCLNELEAKLRRRDSDLKKFNTKIKDKQGEVEQLRETLRQKERELKQMETELESKACDVQVLKRRTNAMAINEQQKTVGEQMKKCQDIGELLERFSQVTKQEDLEKLNNQIMEDITKMKASMKNKKSFSWR
ncbi:interaptin-like [Halichondria panicea]|uniref:interaptin-like n=1 Tax=Halichondria panicea TaxID=6063 RepID=UPI00312B748A